MKIFTWDTPDDKRIYKHGEEKNEMIRNGQLKHSAKSRSKQDYNLKTEWIDRLVINANLFNHTQSANTISLNHCTTDTLNTSHSKPTITIYLSKPTIFLKKPTSPPEYQPEHQP